jgi:hypothetical protein
MKPKQPIVNTGNLVASTKRAMADARREAVLERGDEILELYMDGCSFHQIVQLLGIKESPNYIRYTLTVYDRKKLVAAQRARAHTMVETAVDVARTAIKLGDAGGFRVATDALFKAAAKLAPETYGDKSKVEHSGPNDGPIKLVAATLTDDQLAQIITSGGIGDDE